MHRPPVLLLDEPTVGVDVGSRGSLLEVVRGLADAGAAVLYSTHYLREVEELDAAVAILDRGRLVARDSLRGLIGRHGQPVVKLVEPDLESVYLSMTGRPFVPEETINGDGDGAS